MRRPAIRRTASSTTLGVDVGGTKIATALVDAGGKILAEHTIPTGAGRNAAPVIADIVACVRERLGPHAGDAVALGVGVAGQIDPSDGTVLDAPNVHWHDVPLGAELASALGLPVFVTNDVRAATWGEWLHGAGRGAHDLMTLFVGTGVGGGIVSGGRVLTGCTNTAGEIGHVTIVAGGRQCTCPNRGCLEAYVGGWAIAAQAREAAQADQAGRRLIDLAGSVEAITAKTVAQAFREGDPFARRLMDEVARHLAAGIVTFVNAFNPCLFILGGGVIEGVPELAQMVEGPVRAHALAAATRQLRFARAALGNDAGVVGAAAIARDAVAGHAR
jgi:glucokinase